LRCSAFNGVFRSALTGEVEGFSAVPEFVFGLVTDSIPFLGQKSILARAPKPVKEAVAGIAGMGILFRSELALQAVKTDNPTTDSTMPNPQTESQRLGAFAPALALLAVVILINYVDRGNLSIAAPLVKAEFQLSPFRLGVLFSAFFYSYSAVIFVSGWLVDRFNVNLVAFCFPPAARNRGIRRFPFCLQDSGPTCFRSASRFCQRSDFLRDERRPCRWNSWRWPC
jgi:hypothetical protein